MSQKSGPGPTQIQGTKTTWGPQYCEAWFSIAPFLLAHFSLYVIGQSWVTGVFRPITGKGHGVGRMGHPTGECITIKVQHASILRSHQGRLALAFPTLLWLYCGWFLQWPLPPKSKHLLMSPKTDQRIKRWKLSPILGQSPAIKYTKAWARFSYW